MAKQPDWERKRVEENGFEHSWDAENIARLLRAERARAVRVVEKVQREATVSQFINRPTCEAYRQACDDILAKLKEA